MHRILVDEKRWIGETRFLHALNYCMLLPGPEARSSPPMSAGCSAAGAAVFDRRAALRPARRGDHAGAERALCAVGAYPAGRGLFYGVKCAVLAIVVQALARLAGRALKSAAMVWIAAGAFLALFLFAVPFPAIVAAAGRRASSCRAPCPVR